MSIWEADARLVNSKRWDDKLALAAIIARCVEPGAGQSVRGSRRKNVTDEKVSASRFAEAADMSRPTVLKYVAAWDSMSASLLVPPRSELAPGQDVPLQVDGELFKKHYSGDMPPPKDAPVVPHPAIGGDSINGQAVAALAVSFLIFGPQRPVWLWRNQIVDGVHRILAAESLAAYLGRELVIPTWNMPEDVSERQALTLARSTRIHRSYTDDEYNETILLPLLVKYRGGDVDDDALLRKLYETRNPQPSTGFLDGYGTARWGGKWAKRWDGNAACSIAEMNGGIVCTGTDWPGVAGLAALLDTPANSD